MISAPRCRISTIAVLSFRVDFTPFDARSSLTFSSMFMSLLQYMNECFSDARNSKLKISRTSTTANSLKTLIVLVKKVSDYKPGKGHS
jgi:hypothetical protein